MSIEDQIVINSYNRYIVKSKTSITNPIGFKIKEQIGMAIINPRGIKRWAQLSLPGIE